MVSALRHVFPKKFRQIISSIEDRGKRSAPCFPQKIPWNFKPKSEEPSKEKYKPETDSYQPEYERDDREDIVSVRVPMTDEERNCFHVEINDFVNTINWRIK